MYRQDGAIAILFVSSRPLLLPYPGFFLVFLPTSEKLGSLELVDHPFKLEFAAPFELPLT